MFPRSPHPILAFVTAGFLGTAGLNAQQAQQDLPPVDINSLVKELQGLATKTDASSKAIKLAAAQQIGAAASAGDGGVSYWEEAIRATQIEGAGQDANTFRIWKETEGEIYKEKEIQSAVHLHLEWLALTLQHSAGASVKELLPAVTNYTRELWADIAWINMLEVQMKKDKTMQPAAAPGGRRGGGGAIAKTVKDDAAVIKAHESILNRNLGGSIIVKKLHLGEYVAIDGWEGNSANIDGIYKNIIQPELRAEKDPRVMEYWDIKMKVSADMATQSKLNFEVDKYNTDTRPTLMWGKAQEYVYLGQKNRAATEMYNVIKNFPTHPNAGEWISTLQGLLAPPPPQSATTPGTVPAPGVAPAPAPATAPTAVVPATTAPAPVPAPGVSPSTLTLPGAAPTSTLPGALPGQ